MLRVASIRSSACQGTAAIAPGWWGVAMLALVVPGCGTTRPSPPPDAPLAIAPLPAGPNTRFKEMSPFMSAIGEHWDLQVQRRHLDDTLAFQLTWAMGGQRANGTFARDDSTAYPTHYTGTALVDGVERAVVVDVVEAPCGDASDRMHELRVVVSVAQGPMLRDGCGEFHLPDPP